MRNLTLAALCGAIVLALGVAACGEDSAPLSGTIRIDGSRAMAPLTRAIAKRFMAEHPGVDVTVEASGTNGGFERFCRGETDVTDATDPIDEAAVAACERDGVAWGEVAVANESVVLIVNPDNPVRCLTTKQLHQIWQGNSEVTTHWRQVDDLGVSTDLEMTAWGSGTETDTYAWFTKAINGVEDETRDYNNVLGTDRHTVENIAFNDGLFGYVGYDLYKRNADSVRALEIDSGDGCVAPTPETVVNRTFRPLARAYLLYPSASELARPAMAELMRFYLDNAQEVAPEVGLFALTDEQREESEAALERLVETAGEMGEEAGS